jgi:hypothetical protein
MNYTTLFLSFSVAVMTFGALIPPAQSQTPQHLQQKSDDDERIAKARVFKHPKFNYTVLIPPGGEVRERQDDSGQISIRSRKGYTISLQAGASRRHVPLNQLSRFIEAQFVGPGKPWRQRVKERKTEVSGLPAYEVHYEGPSNLSQVYFVRGQKLDYVFIYIAGHREFPRQLHEFAWILDNFSPSVSADVDKSNQYLTRANKFSQSKYGYSMLYPADWEQSSPQTTTMMFSGRKGTPAFTSIVSIQNVATTHAVSDTTEKEAAVLWATEDLKANLSRAASSVTFSIDQPWNYIRGKSKLTGRELSVSYKHQGQSFRKVIFVVPRPDQRVVHIWSYTAPENDFAKYQPLAEQMLKSWIIHSPSHG